MTDREWLIELMQKCDIVKIPTSKFIEGFADYLLEHGVIVPQCKVGDTVYQIDAERVFKSKVKAIVYDTENIAFDERAIGKTVFLTREEAEQALKERANK